MSVVCFYQLKTNVWYKSQVGTLIYIEKFSMGLFNKNKRPRSEPALELHSRVTSSVGVMYCSSGPSTGSNPKGGRILKKTLKNVAII